MTGGPLLLRTVLAAAIAPLVSASVLAQPSHPGPGMTYESLASLPDLSGSWIPLGGPSGDVPFGGASGSVPPLPAELTPDAAARAAEFRRQQRSGAVNANCSPPLFAGRSAINAAGALEVLFTPGRVTIATESGLVRRIYLRDTPPPGALEESRGGTSIGRWEDGTLVVETTGLMPSARLVADVPIGRGARVTERISLADADTLTIESTTVAPDVLTAPLRSVNRYRRDRERPFTEFDTCVAGDRSFDSESRQERFDVTPPSDLPPPPES